MAFMKDVLASSASIWPRQPTVQELDEALMDEQAFHLFYLETVRPLHAYAVRVLGNASHADDIVQESYFRILRTPPATNETRQLKAVLFKIASNLIIDYWRNRKFDAVPTTDDHRFEGSSDPADVALSLDMARTFAKLKPQERQLMWLAYVEGSDHREIATTLGIGQWSVRVMLHRAKQKLARLIKRERTEQQ
jgi:RNA polymerase sigma-70 factor (ECF subfamily)